MTSAMRSLILGLTNLKRQAGNTFLMPCTVNFQNQIRNKLVKNSPRIKDLDPEKLPEFEITSDPNEWKHVENLIPLQLIPKPKKFDGPAPSGWIPPKEEAINLPYFVPRTKNHMQNVFLHIRNRGLTRVTIIRKIHGNIWLMEQELRQYLEDHSTKYYKHIASRVNEMQGQIRFRGDHVARVKEWMNIKGF